MRRSITVLCLSALISSPLAASEKITIEIGRGIHNNRGSDALFLRYADDLRESRLFGRNFYAWSLGRWDGEGSNNAVGFELGTLGRWGKYHLDGSAGIAYLGDKTSLSGTHQQFSVRIGAGITHGQMDIGAYVTHYSNAKPLFGWDGPNAGYDFISFQIGYVLKVIRPRHTGRVPRASGE